jgi:putative glutamine amidotransferase
MLASIVGDDPEIVVQDGFLRLPVNSSHHQAIGIPGDGLRVVGRCPQDGVVEAVEGGLHPAHFLLGLQWHPERTFESSAASRAIFARLIGEARSWVPRPILTSVV